MLVIMWGWSDGKNPFRNKESSDLRPSRSIMIVIVMPDDLSWSNALCRRIGNALFVTEGRTLTAPEISERIGRAAVKAKADEMVKAGLLEHRTPHSATPGQVKAAGRPPTVAFFLPDASVFGLREALAREHPTGRMEQGQHVVFVEAGGVGIANLFEALDASSALAKASWFTRCDGEPQELAIVFAGDDAADAALELMMEFRGSKLRTRRVVLGSPGSSEQLIMQARRAARAARRSRLAHATRQAS